MNPDRPQAIRAGYKRFLVLSIPALVLATVLSATIIELWVRLQWDEKRGTPGFYVSDPVLGQRLAPGYEGWFAGVPVHINALGFRDPRDYSREKPAGTFRILVFGDSVTFGHGTRSETTYPYLLEQRLRSWRPDVNWEVWNLGVPGYNTGQELAYLNELGPKYDPDLAIIGFFPNDFTNNEVPVAPSFLRRAASAVQRTMQRYLYSYEFYKRVYLTARFNLLADADDRRRIEHLAGEDELLVRWEDTSTSAQQALTNVDRFDDRQVTDFVCPGESTQHDPSGADDLREKIRTNDPSIALWLKHVHELQALGRDGVYRLMFFINMAPKVCAGDDRFYDAGALSDDDLLIDLLGDGVPVASSTRAYMHYRPSQMPAAGGHAVGNANRVKADVLFDYLSTHVLPKALTP